MFTTIIYEPLLNALAIIYNTIAFKDLGIAIIILTLIVRLILYPLFHKMARNQTIMQRIQHRVDEIRHTHKENKEEQAKALLALYREHKINPFSSFLALAIQLPILIVLFNIFNKGFTEDAAAHLYSFVALPTETIHGFFGLLNLAEKSILIAIIVGVAQYIQGRLSFRATKVGEVESPSQKATKKMVLFMPIVVFIIGLQLPSAVGLYYATTTIAGVLQQLIINRALDKEFGNHGKNISDNKTTS